MTERNDARSFSLSREMCIALRGTSWSRIVNGWSPLSGSSRVLEEIAAGTRRKAGITLTVYQLREHFEKSRRLLELLRAVRRYHPNGRMRNYAGRRIEKLVSIEVLEISAVERLSLLADERHPDDRATPSAGGVVRSRRRP